MFKNLLFGLLFFVGIHPLSFAQIGHDFLHQNYDRLHDSPMQEKFRRIAPMPAGVVYIQRPGEGESDIRWHFRTMKELGFNSLKGIYPVGDWTEEEIQLIALEEGLIPWWYGEGGWEAVTDDLLEKLNIPKHLPISEIRTHPAFLAYQAGVLKDRILRATDYREEHPGGEIPKSSSRAFEPSIGGRGLELNEKGKRLFVDWARDRYGSIDDVNRAYNQQHANLGVGGGGPFKNWDDFSARWLDYNHREYRVRRDIFRFKADMALENIRRRVEEFHAFNPHAPFRAGGELNLFRPQPWWNVDFEGIADVMRSAGSFYPSIHFSWHFDEVEDEIVQSSYMQAAFMNDLFKGGWSAAWECSGGPQQFDGEKFGDPYKGFTVDDRTLTQFFLSQLAAGFKGFGIWCWSTRTAGKEAGEYSLLDRNNEVTDRAIAVSRIGKAMQTWRDELWAAHKEPQVGILWSWDNDAIWSAMSDRGRDDFRDRPMQARVGISRVFIENNVPFEYVTCDDIRNGLAPRYPVIYLPAILALNQDLMLFLEDYVKQGGRLVLDMPGAWYDEFSQLYPTHEGTIFERIFGVVIGDYQYAGRNRAYQIGDLKLLGSIGSFRPTHANVAAFFDDGKPAITEASYGRGSAVLVGCEFGRMYFKDPSGALAQMILRHALGDSSAPFNAVGAYVYRLAGKTADHYFLINDGPETEVTIHSKILYSGMKDAVSGEVFQPNDKIKVDGFSGRWMRFAK
ncbi:MAG: beta-galactosidase trimerization domain-containing protein [Verrucomicrobiae bacterium]|nr:beta-galactosidase trimerization domain-containing protein [Verrucomicrobiae bacterium]